MDNFGINEENIAQLFVAQTDKQRRLTATLLLYRHKREFEKIEAEIADNSPIPTQNDNKVKRAIIDGTVNAYRRMETQRLSKDKTECIDKIAAFKAKCKADGVEPVDGDEAAVKKEIAEFFEGDRFDMQRVLFAMHFVLSDNLYRDDFIYGDDTIADVSTLLFGDERRIRRIKEKFYENFKELTNGSFWERNKYFVIGTGVAIALVAVLTPLALGAHAAGSAVVTSCLAQIGHSAPGLIGAGIATVTDMAVTGSIAFGGVALAAAIGVNEIVRYEHTRDAFRKLKPDDFAASLAMHTTLIDFVKPLMDDETCKEGLNNYLQLLNDWRADAEYMLIVEKCDAENSKKKIQICNRFVNRLAVIAGI